MNELKTPNVQYSMTYGANLYGSTRLQPSQLVFEIMSSCHGLA